MNARRGFTLAEMAVAVVILALLLFGAMVPFSAQVDIRSVADTRRTMDAIKEAIVGFAQANGRLPCAADGSIAAGAPGAGIEQVSGTVCTAAFGAVPWATLGVPETDGWSRRFSYWVSPVFSDAISLNTFGCAPTPTPIQSSFALCSLGTLTVNTRKESDHSVTAVGLVLPAVIISHGRNGFGAYTPGGGPRLAVPAGTDEAVNATDAGTTFFSRTPTQSASPCSDAAGPAFCEFDDIVVMITSNTLIARMVAAGRLP
jgi:prepilin-type N-terminal cleavage/methylation domain-containing protein